MKRLFVLTLATGLLVGCASHYRDTSPYYGCGRIKPIVTVLPVMDKREIKAEKWDLAREFTEEIRQHTADSSRIFLAAQNDGLQLAEALNTPNVADLSKVKCNGLNGAEFVVVTELLDQHQTFIERAKKNKSSTMPQQTGAILSIAMRLRVLDVRKGTPKVILQEVIHQDYDIAKPYMHTDYSKITWGSDAFENTPMGIAHNQLVRELVAHVEGYVQAN